MGAVGTHTSCSCTCDRQHQVKVGEETQAYAPYDLDVTGSERLPAEERKPFGELAAEVDDEDYGSWSSCCATAETGSNIPWRMPLAAGVHEAGSENRRRFCCERTQRKPGALAAEGAAGRKDVSRDGDDQDPIELMVEVTKRSPDDDLGIKVLHRGIGVLMVQEIYPGGATEASNRSNARSGSRCLEVGDQIAIVNGVGGDDAAMAEECKRSQHLILGVRRCKAPSPARPSEEKS